MKFFKRLSSRRSSEAEKPDKKKEKKVKKEKDRKASETSTSSATSSTSTTSNASTKSNGSVRSYDDDDYTTYDYDKHRFGYPELGFFTVYETPYPGLLGYL